MPPKGAMMSAEQRARISAAMKGRRLRVRRNGDSASPEYHAWHAMIQRCCDEKNPRYVDYGGRGISVCDAWLDYDTFLADMARRPSAAHSLDRIDNDGNYEPGNCRWATAREQVLNSRPYVSSHQPIAADDWVSLPAVPLDDEMWPAAHLLLSVTPRHDAPRAMLERYTPVCRDILDVSGHDGYHAFVSHLAHETWRRKPVSARFAPDITPEHVRAQWKLWSALRVLSLL